MLQLRDDPIIESMMRTGYPPWYDDDEEYDAENFDDEVDNEW